MELDEGNLKILSYVMVGGATIGGSAVFIISKIGLWKIFKKKTIEVKEDVSSSREIELEKQLEEARKELREKEIESLAGIIETVKSEMRGLKKAFHEDLEDSMNTLKNFFEERYVTKENFFLLIQLVGKLTGEISAMKDRMYPTVETSKRDLIDRGIKIDFEEVYNNNTEINNVLNSLYQVFGGGRR